MPDWIKEALLWIADAIGLMGLFFTLWVVLVLCA